MTDAGRWRSTPPPVLAPNAVHVWRIRLDVGGDDALYTVLSEDERARANAFAFPALRRHYVIAHGTLRALLATYLDVPSGSLRFAVGEHGKPHLGDPASDLTFNLSHSGDIGLVAVTCGKDIGVDVERHSSRISPAELAQRVFSRAECEALEALPPEVRTDAFYAAWTRKEAYMKATGHGITRGFAHFDVTLAPGAAPQLLADRLDTRAHATWDMRSLDVGEGYSAALVASAPVAELLLFDAAPAGVPTDAR